MNNNDAQIARLMCFVPHHLMLRFMEQQAENIQDDNNYWNLLGTAWKAGGCFKDQDRWIALFKSDRRNKNKIMKSSERREFNKLPKQIVAYRAYAADVEIEQSICWTTDKKFAEHYAKANDLLIAQMNFSRDRVFAFFNRRNESEILVWREKSGC